MVPLCTIYNHIQASGGVQNVEIDQEVRNAARNASSEYLHELMKQEEESKGKEKEDANKDINCRFLHRQPRDNGSWDIVLFFKKVQRSYLSKVRGKQHDPYSES